MEHTERPTGTITIYGDEFVNVESFYDWLIDKANGPIYDISPWLVALASDYGSTGSTWYELDGFYAKSKNPETFWYDVEYHYFMGGREMTPEEVEELKEWDDLVTRFIF